MKDVLLKLCYQPWKRFLKGVVSMLLLVMQVVLENELLTRRTGTPVYMAYAFSSLGMRLLAPSSDCLYLAFSQQVKNDVARTR